MNSHSSLWMKNIRDSLNHLSVTGISNGIIAWLFGVTGPLLIVLQSAAKGNLTPIDITSWIFSIYFTGGVLTLLLSCYYRQPIVVAFSIPGAVLVGSSLAEHTFSEVTGAYIVTGILILVLGLSGVVNRLLSILPMPIMMGMVAGVLLPFGVDTVIAIAESPVLNGVTFLVFLLISLIPHVAKKFPPILGAMIAAAVLITVSGLANRGGFSVAIARPQIYVPSFDPAALAELVIPLALTVIAIQNAQGIGVLKSVGYEPPINAMTNWSGIGSIINGFFGAHTACIAGPMTAIVAGSDTGCKESRYSAGVVVGVLWILFGVFAPVTISLIQMVPPSLIKLLGGLAMLAVLVNSLKMAFSSEFKMGALFAFMITISGITPFHIGAPFWGLAGGTFVSLILERKDFSKGLV